MNVEEQAIRVASKKRVPNPLGFTDDIYDECALCGKEVMLRPGGPMPPEVEIHCVDCAWPVMVAAKRDGQFEARSIEGTSPIVKQLLDAVLAKAVKEEDDNG
jgi:hypothetical protein